MKKANNRVKNKKSSTFWHSLQITIIKIICFVSLCLSRAMMPPTHLGITSNGIYKEENKIYPNADLDYNLHALIFYLFKNIILKGKLKKCTSPINIISQRHNCAPQNVDDRFNLIILDTRHTTTKELNSKPIKTYENK